ncbi:MAG: hypothetical protein AB1813_07865 [Verrucomicrobiota bacterium]
MNFPASIPRIARKRCASTRRNFLCCLVAIGFWFSSEAEVLSEAPFLPGVVVQFADARTGAAHLHQTDPFIRALSRFDRESRMQTNSSPSTEEFRQFASQQAMEWEAQEIKRFKTALSAVRERMAAFSLPLPKTILLIKTTGQEEGDAAYCRRNAIVIARKIAQNKEGTLERLLTHELFHILSSHNAKLRDALYAQLGFERMDHFDFPETLKDRKITNPDAPELSHFLRLEHEKQTLAVVPILYANTDRFDPAAGKTFFHYLTFRLLVVERDGERWRARMRDNGLWLLDPANVPAFHRHVGRNTKYILHPEEVLADNFVFLMFGKSDLPNPEIPQRMRELLRKAQ